MCGNLTVRDEVNNNHCRSVLDRGANTLTLHVRCSVQAVSTYVDHPPGVRGSVTYTCRPLDSTTVDNFKRAFPAAIREHWHNRLWIAPVLPDPNIAPLQCGVEVTFVNSGQNPHCRITLLYEPEPAPGERNIPFRSFCYNGGHSNVQHEDMVIAYKLINAGRADDFDWTNSREAEDGGELVFAPFTQNLAAHEFGHYLGLNHRCSSPLHANGAADYCHRRQHELVDNMMASGNRLSAGHGQPWASRLRRHHYHCDRGWVPNTEPMRHHAGLIDSLAGAP